MSNGRIDADDRVARQYSNAVEKKKTSENVPQVGAATSTKHAKSFTEKFSITALENDSL